MFPNRMPKFDMGIIIHHQKSCIAFYKSSFTYLIIKPILKSLTVQHSAMELVVSENGSPFHFQSSIVSDNAQLNDMGFCSLNDNLKVANLTSTVFLLHSSIYVI